MAARRAYMAPEQAAGAAGERRERLVRARRDAVRGADRRAAVRGRRPRDAARRSRRARRRRASTSRADVPADLDALCAELLARDPSARPDAAVLARAARASSPTTRARRAARDAVDAARTRSSSSAATRELAALRAAFAASRDGDKPVIVLLSGESGIGKSALVERFLAELARRRPRASCSRGRCYERESVPFKGFDAVDRRAQPSSAHARARSRPRSCCRARRPRCAGCSRCSARIDAIAVAPERSVPDAHELRRRGFLALGELLARIRDASRSCSRSTTCSGATPTRPRCSCICLRQPDAPRMLLDREPSQRSMRASTPVLEPLYERCRADIRLDVQRARGRAARSDAARRSARRRSQRRRRRWCAKPAGNPFLLGELARRDRCRRRRGGELRLSPARARPRRAAARARARAARGAGGRRAAACARARGRGRRDPRGRARSVRRAARGAARAQRRAATAASSATTTACARRSPPAARGRAARAPPRAGERARAREDADPEHLSEHFEHAGEAELARALRGARRPSARCARSRSSARRRSTSARCAGAFDAREARSCRVALGDALSHCGRGPAAAEAYLQVAEHADFAARPELEQKAAEQLLMSGHLERGHALLVDALAALEVTLPRSPLGAARRCCIVARACACAASIARRRRACARRLRARLQALLSSTSALSRTDALYAAEAAARYLVDGAARRRRGRRRTRAGLGGAVLDRARRFAGASAFGRRARASAVRPDRRPRGARRVAPPLRVLPVLQPGAGSAGRRCASSKRASRCIASMRCRPRSYDRPWGEWNRATVRGYLGHYAEVARELPAHQTRPGRAPICASRRCGRRWCCRGSRSAMESSAERELERARKAWNPAASRCRT